MPQKQPEKYDKALDVIMDRVGEVLDSTPPITFTSDGSITAVVPLTTPLEGDVASPLLDRLAQLLTPRGFTLAYTPGARTLTLTRMTRAGETVGGTLAHSEDGPSDKDLAKHIRAGTLIAALLATMDVGLYDEWSRTEVIAAMGFVLAFVMALQKIYEDNQ